ncbi:Gfo/Idh/MocA family protein [Azospirillum argentinense]|uniref:Gfo/Idh/MocA family oxidoreductase n=1 Tax=Azospirillum brasilense TaxID=192 RepID=A0A4D8Q6X7_AZOBR|nr:Gfo/Idh/MocA family oxidoreductase [Azospirillum argentinense]QCO06317.1 gfo/Idh/MocA family oxidoreductase [Azospirillum argentinense]
MSPLRIAVAGAGVIGKTHIDAMSDPRQDAHPCRLAAIVDPGEGARALAERHGVPHHADIGALLESGDLPDGVIVATPNATHTPIGIACIERGIPVLVEKPIADTVEAARRLTDAAERAGVPLLVGHHRRHNPILRMAREVIGRGDLGALVMVTILYTFLKPDGYFDAVWRREEGGGPILINLIHEIDTLRFLCGDIESLQASSSNRTRGFAVEDTAAVLLRLRSGALATVSLSDAAATPWSWDMTTGESPQFARQHVPTHFFSGTHGSLTVPTLELWRYEGGRGWLDPFTRTALPLKPGNPYALQLAHFARVIRGEEAPLASGSDATETLRATLAVKEAAATGQPVRLLDA